MTSGSHSRLVHFLQEELAVSAASIAIGLRYLEQDPGPLPIILWKYGLITLEQLNRVYDWLETG